MGVRTISQTIDLTSNKASRIKTQPIYYRSNSPNIPNAPTTTVINDAVSNNIWTIRRLPVIDSNDTSYRYCYTCVQYIDVMNNLVGISDIVPDEASTIIDGSSIITGSLAASKITSHSITSDQLNVTELNVSQALTLGALTSETKAVIDGKASATDVATLKSAITIDPINQLSRFGYVDGFHILIDSKETSANKGISFWYGSETEPTNKTAFIDGKYLTIPFTVVLNAMDIGNDSKWRWEKNETTNHLTLKWIGGSSNG